MLINLTLSVVICIVLIILTHIIINYAIFLEKIRIKSQYGSVTEEFDEIEHDYTNLQEGLTNVEYYALSNSINKIETVDPSQVFLTSDTMSIYNKTKGNVYYNSPIQFLDSYDNSNIINYIDALVNINNTTDKNFNKLSIASKKKDEIYSKYSSFINMKQYLNINKPNNNIISENTKLLEQQKMDERIIGTSINDKLDIAIKNKLYDTVYLLYTDYTNYIADLQGKFNTVKNSINEEMIVITDFMNNVDKPLLNNINESINKLKNGIRDLKSLKASNIDKTSKKQTGNFNNTRDTINNNVENLQKYVSLYTNIKDNKIIKPTTESNNIPLSIASYINVYLPDINDEIKKSIKTLDVYLKNQNDNYNEFLKYYNDFNNNSDTDFITKIEQEYLTNDYNKKLMLFIKDMNNNSEINNIFNNFKSFSTTKINEITNVAESLKNEINDLTSKSNNAILSSNKIYVIYKKSETVKKKAKCVIS